MPCDHVGNIIVCYSDSYEVAYRGRTWRFEWHSFCGPLWVNKNGDSIDPQRVPHAVWDMCEPIFELLCGGKKEEAERLCAVSSKAWPKHVNRKDKAIR